MYKKLFIIQSVLIVFAILGFGSWQVYTNLSKQEKSETKVNEDIGVFKCNSNVTMEYDKTVNFRTNSKADRVAPPNTRYEVLEMGTRMGDDYVSPTDPLFDPRKEYYISIACSPLADGYHYEKWDIFKSTEKGILREPPDDNLELLSKVFPYQDYDVLYHPDKKTTWELRDKEGYTIGITMRNLDYTLEKTGLKVIIN